MSQSDKIIVKLERQLRTLKREDSLKDKIIKHNESEIRTLRDLVKKNIKIVGDLEKKSVKCSDCEKKI